MNCSVVGDANPDIVGIGILISFIIQAGLAIAISFYSFKLSLTAYTSRVQELQPWQMKMKIANKILVQGSDVQSTTGIALLVSAIVQNDSLPFYHLHIIYDTVSLVAISIAGAIVCSFDKTLKHKTQRYGLMVLWAVLYLVYTSIFGKRLQSWNWNSPGHCYNPHKTSLANASHPTVDYIYIGLTCLYLFASLFAVVMVGGVGEIYPDPYCPQGCCQVISSFMVLTVAAFQFPLHVYSIFALRASNEALLSSGAPEQQWGFGQIVAIILLGTNIVVLVNGIQDYLEWKIEVGR